MSEVIRLYKFQALLSSRRALSRAELMALLEVSPATFKRDIAKLRDQLGTPIEYDRELVADLLGYGNSAKALNPASLVKSMKSALAAAMTNYS